MMVHGILLNIGQSVLKVMFNIGWSIIPIYEIVPTFWCWFIFLSPPFIDVNCNSPPARPRGGTWDWTENFSFGSFVEYTCGPFARFKNKEGQLYEDARVECFWNKTLSPSKLDACQGVRHGLTIFITIHIISYILWGCPTTTSEYRAFGQEPIYANRFRFL